MKRWTMILFLAASDWGIRGQSLPPLPLGDLPVAENAYSSDVSPPHPFWKAMIPPANAAALSGYHGLVPLAWSPVVSDSLVGYDVYKGTSPAGPFGKTGYTVINPYFRDADVVNGTRYYYKIKSVYRNSQSGYTSMIDGQPKENGYILNSTWAAAAPVIDGVINSSEWPQNKAVDISFPARTREVLLYVMNDQSTLFLAVDDRKNTRLDDWDSFGMYFDRDLDHEWSVEAGAEGLLQFHWEAGTTSVKSRFVATHGKWPNALSLEPDVVLPGMRQGISFNNGHVQFEMAVNLHESPLRYRPFSSFGYFIYSYDRVTNYLSGMLPQEVEAKLTGFAGGMDWSKAPFAFGDLNLAQAESPDFWADVDRDHDVDIMDIQLLAGRWGTDRLDANYIAEYDINADGCINIFDIQSVAAWWNKPIPSPGLFKNLEIETCGTVSIRIFRRAPGIYEIWAADAVDLAAFQMNFHTRGAKLQRMVLGDFLGQTGNTAVALPSNYSAEDGRAAIGAFSYGVHAGASGTGKMAELTFTGRAEIALMEIKCADRLGNAIVVVMKDMDQPVLHGESPQFRLAQNYPNPFNPFTMISFSLPNSGEVSLSVFDITGHEVVRTDYGVLAPGWHQLSFNGNDLPSGKYIYRLQAGSQSAVKSMLLLR
jgi:hypothetical protein